MLSGHQAPGLYGGRATEYRQPGVRTADRSPRGDRLQVLGIGRAAPEWAAESAWTFERVLRKEGPGTIYGRLERSVSLTGALAVALSGFWRSACRDISFSAPRFRFA